MKKITEKSTKAFINGKSFNEGNTEVKRLDSGDLEFNLFGNRIALLTDNQTTLIINHCGWLTNTTKERLNGLLSVYNLGYIQQEKKRFYYKHGKKVIDMGHIDSDDHFKIFLKPKKVYVTMTDKFMSGWGMAENLINKYIIVCDNYRQADIITRNAHKRPEMKYINIRSSFPSYGSQYLPSFENFNELGEIWTKA